MARVLRSTAYGLLCALATVSARAEYVYHDIVLSGALDGRHDVAFCFGVDGDRIEQQWAYLPDRPGEVCRIVSSQLRSSDEQITGSVSVEASVSGSSAQRFTAVLDLPLRTNGEYSVAFGCPEPSRTIAGAVTVESPAPDRPDRYTIWLAKALGEKTRLGLVVQIDRDRKTLKAEHALASAYNTAIHPLDTGGLSFDGKTISGTVEFTILPDRWVPVHRQKIEGRAQLKVQLDNQGNAGRYSAVFGIERKRTGKARVTRARAQAEFGAKNSLAAGATWPSWLGPNQNFSSGPSKRPVVEDLRQARRVWVSEDIGPPESGSKRYGSCIGLPPCAGGASPLVADGKVYQFRYEATGTVYQSHVDQYLDGGAKAKEGAERLAAHGWKVEDLKKRWLIDADEELVCLDAATGRTLWKVRFPGEGLNLYDHKCSLTNHTGAWSDGVVYVFGALGIVRAVDGSSGKVKWSAAVPGYHEAMVELKEKSLARRSLDAPSRSFCHGLNAVGPVVVAPTSRGAGGVVGIDRATGKVRWTAPDCLGSYVTPMALRLGDDEFVLCSDSTKVTVLDPATGKLVYTIDPAGENSNQPLLVGDILIVQALGSDRRKALDKEMATKDPRETFPEAIFSAPGSNLGRVKAWRLGTDGAAELWTAPLEWGAPNHGPVGSAIGDLVCFRGNFSYYIVKAATGERIASSYLSSPARFDEGILFALPGLFVLQPDSQHGHNKFYPFPATAGADVRPVWNPPHDHATTYQVGMSHAWADGRLFIRGKDAIHCYDLRRSK